MIHTLPSVARHSKIGKRDTETTTAQACPLRRAGTVTTIATNLPDGVAETIIFESVASVK
jgi:tRNA G10  N-methylase Trm11